MYKRDQGDGYIHIQNRIMITLMFNFNLKLL